MPVLECSGLGKRFGSVDALADVSIRLEPGRITGLLFRYSPTVFWE